ncbi:FAD-dependent urate hydroxylase HpxO [Salana multivorans]
MKAIVVGAGMAGTTAAMGLERIGYDVEILERVREVRPVGAAISIWSNGVKCLNYLGLGDKVAALGGDMASMAYYDAFTGETMTQFSLAPLVDDVGQKPYPVARGDLQVMLMEEFGLDKIRLGAEVTSVSQENGTVTAHLADGSEVSGDLLIGADGAHSRIREYVLGGPTERRYSGYVNYNGLVPALPEIGPPDQWSQWVGNGMRVSVMPVAGDRFYFFLDVVIPTGLSWDRSTLREELRGYFGDWAPPVQALIEAIDIERTNRVEIHDIEPFFTWTKGRVALLGDAGHSTTPDIGQGGCAAFEDAVELSWQLGTSTLGVEDALERYAARRAPRTAELVLRARGRCDVTHGKDPEVTQAWYEELRRSDGTDIIGGIEKNIVGGPFG